jgi:hypothetical protein
MAILPTTRFDPAKSSFSDNSWLVLIRKTAKWPRSEWSGNQNQKIMKQFFLLALFVMLAGTATLQAQCMRAPQGGGCCSARSAAVETPSVTPEQVAAADESIEKQVDEASGETSYVRRTVNEATGEIIFTEVTFDTEAGAFVQATRQGCQGHAAAGQSAEGQQGGACCQQKAATDPENTSAPQPRPSSRVKLVRSNNN